MNELDFSKLDGWSQVALAQEVLAENNSPFDSRMPAPNECTNV